MSDEPQTEETHQQRYDRIRGLTQRKHRYRTNDNGSDPEHRYEWSCACGAEDEFASKAERDLFVADHVERACDRACARGDV